MVVMGWSCGAPPRVTVSRGIRQTIVIERCCRCMVSFYNRASLHSQRGNRIDTAANSKTRPRLCANDCHPDPPRNFGPSRILSRNHVCQNRLTLRKVSARVAVRCIRRCRPFPSTRSLRRFLSPLRCFERRAASSRCCTALQAGAWRYLQRFERRHERHREFDWPGIQRGLYSNPSGGLTIGLIR
jgi:hypothetical protein